MSTIFNYQAVANKLGIPDEVVRIIENDVKKEIPDDNMIMELHILRALKSYNNKHQRVDAS